MQIQIISIRKSLINDIMKNAIYFILAVTALLYATPAALNAQVKISPSLEIDKTTYDFGDILLDSGPVSCDYTITNTGDEPCVIYNVTTSCGCTDAEWTRQPLKKGEQGKISITYSNDEGPYPFDKSITVYISSLKKPLILKLKGTSIEKKRPLEVQYPAHIGSLGLKETYIKVGNLEQGKSKTETVLVANLSSSPLHLDFKDVEDNLDITVTPNPIPAKSTSEMAITVNADRGKWGRNNYQATPLLNGKTVTDAGSTRKISAWAFTKENFDNLTEDEIGQGSMPRFQSSTFDFGKVKVGTGIHATFTLKNEGKSCFCIYKVDVDACCYSHSDIPAADPGEEVSFRVHLDTKDMPKGECLKIVTLTTNSPLRPIVNLFISGVLE